MKDFVPKGTGNSRFLKSVSNFLSKYPTYNDMAEALVSGTLPIDLNGINSDGVAQIGTPLSKANLLTDETAAALELPQSDPTVNDAFQKTAEKFRNVFKVGDTMTTVRTDLDDSWLLCNGADYNLDDYPEYTNVAKMNKVIRQSNYNLGSFSGAGKVYCDEKRGLLLCGGHNYTSSDKYSFITVRNVASSGYNRTQIYKNGSSDGIVNLTVRRFVEYNGYFLGVTCSGGASSATPTMVWCPVENAQGSAYGTWRSFTLSTYGELCDIFVVDDGLYIATKTGLYKVTTIDPPNASVKATKVFSITYSSSGRGYWEFLNGYMVFLFYEVSGSKITYTVYYSAYNGGEFSPVTNYKFSGTYPGTGCTLGEHLKYQDGHYWMLGKQENVNKNVQYNYAMFDLGTDIAGWSWNRDSYITVNISGTNYYVLDYEKSKKHNVTYVQVMSESDSNSYSYGYLLCVNGVSDSLSDLLQNSDALILGPATSHSYSLESGIKTMDCSDSELVVGKSTRGSSQNASMITEVVHIIVPTISETNAYAYVKVRS